MFPYDYETPKYPIREAAAAAGFELNSLRSLYQRGHFRVVGGVEAQARGIGASLNLRDIMHIAVAKRLMDVGVHPKDAFEAAMFFAHTGKGGSGWVGEPMQGPIRNPAGMFSNGRTELFTVLIYFASNNQSRIVPMEKQTLDFSTLFINRATGQRDNPVLIYLNDVERQVFLALDVRGTKIAE